MQFKKRTTISAPVQPILQRIEWGKKHPQYGIRSDKIKWTAYEVRFIGRWMEKKNKMDSQRGLAQKSTSVLLRECLYAIPSDYPEMVDHFHDSHVVCLSTFQWGYTRYLKLPDDQK